jgi:hypothetical protein
MSFRIQLAIVVLLCTIPSVGQITQQEVILSGQAWRYTRVYPLLDGLFQDVASTQLKSLVLDPNVSSGTSLDAMQQSIQFQLQYSQLAGIQNAAAAQTIATNTGYQTQLIQQQATLLQAQLLAQRQLGEAQNKLDALPGTADPNTIAAAKQAVTLTQDDLNSITAQMALVKGQLAAPAYSPSPATNALVPSQLPTPTAIPSSLSSAVTGTPSFPATKQMDNQMQLLWERLSRLVGVMARPDSLETGASLYLVEFDTGVFLAKGKRKHQLLDTTYALGCTGGSGTPAVLDMFPRAAAVNITNIKYRDTSFGIGALLSFFGIGISGSYNREHLRLSQLLGQSSYITGHGVGQASFGWLFGIAVGDDQISSDTKKTFALIEVPSKCTEASVSLQSAAWSSKPAATVASLPPLSLPAPTPPPIGIASISFNRIEYDPMTSASSPPAVTLRVDVNQDLDQQETVSVNGVPIRRARDTFGRAISGGGSGGLLEATALGLNTWVPFSPRTLLITLDASMFGERFPLVLLSSPAGAIDLTTAVSDTTDLVISGYHLRCSGTPCARVLPSLGYVKSSVKQFLVARCMGRSRDKDRISITLASSPNLQASVQPSAAQVASVQVIQRATDQIWGDTVAVSMLSENGDITQLKCDPAQRWSRLLCNAPGYDQASDTYARVTLDIVDTRHAGGPIKGSVELPACSNNPAADSYCRQPLIWDIKGPQWYPEAPSGWLFDLVIINVDPSQNVFFSARNGILRTTTQNCSEDNGCDAPFRIPLLLFPIVKDSMEVRIQGSSNKLYSATILNLFTNMRPMVTQIDDAKVSWSGQNLVFKKLRLGDTGTIHSVDCSDDATSCRVVTNYGPKETGYLHLIDVSPPVELVQVNSSGGLIPVFVEKAKGQTPGPATKTGHALMDALTAPAPTAVPLNKSLTVQVVQ